MSTPIDGSTHTITHDTLSKTIEGNWVLDGGFTNKELTNWTSNDAGSGASSHNDLVTYESFPSLQLKITNTTDNAERYQDIYPAYDSTSFEFSAAFKTRNLGADDDDKGIYIDVYYTDGTSDLASSNSDQVITPSYDTGGWEIVSDSFSTNGAKEIDYMRVRCRLADISNQSGTGYMWVTHVVVIDAANTKENESFNVDNDGDICVVPEIELQGNTIHMVDQFYGMANQDADQILDDNNEHYVQVFSPTQRVLSKVMVCVKKTGTPTVDLTVKLLYINHSNGEPVNLGTDHLALATIDKDNVTTSYQWFELDLGFVQLDTTWKYGICFQSTGVDASNYYQIAKDDSSSSYAGGTAFYTTDDGVNWTEESTKDYIFATKYPVHCGEVIKIQSDAQQYSPSSQQNIGMETTWQKGAQSFLSDFNQRLHSVLLRPYTHAGTPTDDLIVTIQECEYDSDWIPTGVILAKQTISNADWIDKETGSSNAQGKILEVKFPYPPLLKKDVTYAIVIERTGSLDDTNYYKIYEANAIYADGKNMYWDGSSWTTTTDDFTFCNYYTSTESTLAIQNSTTGEILQLKGQLLTNAKITIHRDGTGTYIHDNLDDANWESAIWDFTGDIRNYEGATTGGDYKVASGGASISGSGEIVCEYDLLFPCKGQPELSYKFDNGSYVLYYSLDNSEWIRLTSGGDEGSSVLTVDIPINNISKFYLKIDGSATLIIYEWEVTANLDCSKILTKLRLPGIGNSSIKPMFSGLNSQYSLDLSWTEVDGCTEYFVISDESEYGYEMTAQVTPISTPSPRTHIRTLSGYGVTQSSQFPNLSSRRIDIVDFSSNFADIAKVLEYISKDRLVYIHTKYEFFQGLLSEMMYQVISGEVNFRRLVVNLRETRQI